MGTSETHQLAVIEVARSLPNHNTAVVMSRLPANKASPQHPRLGVSVMDLLVASMRMAMDEGGAGTATIPLEEPKPRGAKR